MLGASKKCVTTVSATSSRPPACFSASSSFRGEIDLDTYRQAMGGLIEHIRTDVRVAPVSRGLNEARLLIDDG